MNKLIVKRVIGLILIVVGLGILLSSIALNLRQYYSKKETIKEIKECISTGIIQHESVADDSDSGASDTTDDMMYILRIPSIDSENPVREGVSRSVLADSLGHETGTAFPGNEGNCVIAGHRNYTFGRFFNRLDEVEKDDLIYVDTVDGTYTYAVSEIKVVEPDDVSVLEDTPDKYQLTLYTCTPIYIASHRLIIIADRVQ